MKKLLTLLILLLGVIPALAGTKTFTISTGDEVQGHKRINIVKGLERFLSQGQIANHKLMQVRVTARAHDSSSFGELTVNGYGQGIRPIPNRAEARTVAFDSPQFSGQYELNLNGYMSISRIEVDVKSLLPELGPSVALDNFHAGRTSEVTRTIGLDFNRSVGEITLNIIGADVEIEELWIYDNFGNRKRILVDFEINEGGRHVISFAQNQFNRIRHIVVKAENELFFGRLAEVFVSVRYWDF